MNDEQLKSTLSSIDDELRALRIGLKIITGALSRAVPNNELAQGLESGLAELKQISNAPKRSLEYLEEMIKVARQNLPAE